MRRLRYGSPSSVRVTIVLDEIGRGEADLYVDANRNRRIEWPDRVAGENRTCACLSTWRSSKAKRPAMSAGR